MEKNHTVCIAHCYNEYRPAAFQYRRHGYHRKNSAKTAHLQLWVQTVRSLQCLSVYQQDCLSVQMCWSHGISVQKKRKYPYRCYFIDDDCFDFRQCSCGCWLFHSFAIIKVDQYSAEYHMNVVGIALATVIATALSATIVMYWLFRNQRSFTVTEIQLQKAD